MPPDSHDRLLRKHVLYLLRDGGSHLSFEDAVRDLPASVRGVKPPGAAHSPWQIVEHMRIAQWDIVEFSRNPAHESPPWPAGYWPSVQPPDNRAWDTAIAQFHAGLDAMCEMVESAPDLLIPFEHGDGQTLLREALVLADHNSYHLGELVLVRRLLGAWNQ